MTTPPIHIIQRPRFVAGLDYVRTDNKKWPYHNLRNLSIQFRHLVMPAGRGVMLMSGDMPCGSIRRNALTVAEGYAWNGNTCWFDSEGTMLSSLFHDLLFQFSGCADWPKHLTNEWADDVYFNLATGPWRTINAMGLALFSSAFWGSPRAGLSVNEFSTIEPI